MRVNLLGASDQWLGARGIQNAKHCGAHPASTMDYQLPKHPRRTPDRPYPRPPQVCTIRMMIFNDLHTLHARRVNSGLDRRIERINGMRVNSISGFRYSRHSIPRSV